jgi:ATP-binding cassette subfamily G (WHITE) protein 2 (SNQ2)
MDSQGEKLTTAPSSSNSDVDTLDSYSHGKQLEEVRIANTQPNTSFQTGVDVRAAENDFLELNRQFSSISHKAHRLSTQVSRVSKTGIPTQDVEKAEGSTQSNESWDLETSLRGDRVAAEEAGIKDKHIGEFIVRSQRSSLLMKP